MAEIPKSMLKIADFRGMASNFDATDLNPGQSEIQVNVSAFKRGTLEVRRGLREINFSDDED